MILVLLYTFFVDLTYNSCLLHNCTGEFHPMFVEAVDIVGDTT